MAEKHITAKMIVFGAFAAMYLMLFCVTTADAQRIAVISPEKGTEPETYADRLLGHLSDRHRTVERSAAEAAFTSLSIATPFNQTAGETRSAGNVIGADILIFVKVETQRRSSFEKPKYFESSAALFLTGARSGELFHFELRKAEKDTPEEAFDALLTDTETTADAITSLIPDLYRQELNARSDITIEDHSRSAEQDKTTRPPMPYRQIKPTSTGEAFLFGIHATIDAEAGIDANGTISDIRVIRWAGYGLEKAVTDAIRKMTWRPAERNGKNLPMRVMLRYNFTKIEKTEKN